MIRESTDSQTGHKKMEEGVTKKDVEEKKKKTNKKRR